MTTAPPRFDDPSIDGGAPVVSFAETEIEAPIEHVCEVLTAVERWPAWNPDNKEAEKAAPSGS